MFRNLMHAFTGSPLQNAAQGVISGAIGSSMSTGQLAANIQNSILRQEVPVRRSGSKKIFSGNIEVSQVANGYTVNIGTREGYEYTTHIAHTITEVNEIIAAAMVAFQLEK